MTASSSNYDESEQPLKFFDSKSNRRIGGSYSGGAGSLSSDRIKCCKICAANGFPHEAITFKQSGVVEELYPFDFTVYKKVVVRKWLVLDYFEPSKQHAHRHKCKSQRGEGGCLANMSSPSRLQQGQEYRTEDCLIEEIFLQLAGTKEIVNHDDKRVTICKYYNRAFRLRRWIPVAKPAPEFIVQMSDLSKKIIEELKALDKDGSQYVLKQAVGRIFENVDFRQYHLSIARKLEVVLKP